MLKGSVFAMTAMVMVGSSVAVLGVLRDFPVYTGQALRFALAAALLLVALKLQDRRTGQRPPAVTGPQWLRITMLAAIGMVGFNVAVVAAEQRTDPALVGVIVGCAPVVIALITPVLARTPPSRRILFAGLVVTAGAALAQGLGSSTSVLGVVFSVGALLGEVAFALVAAPLLGDLGALRVSTYACVAAVPLCLIGMAATGQYAVPDGSQLLALLWLSVVVTAGAYVLWFTAVGSIGPERAGLFTSLIPISAVGVTALIGTGEPTWGHAFGAIIVLLGLLVGLTTRKEPDVTIARGADELAWRMPWAGRSGNSPDGARADGL
ncbi:DMT family transporter [Streptomyces sp. NPDC127108]|uniref:DMT family transporter n=1 Tax=Streptomyces sp. NPDC127108 TaxID=3345361 RepID=UPI0036294566